MIKKIIGLCLVTILYSNASVAHIDHSKYHDYRAAKQSVELQKMQEFHLQQAKNKMQQKQLTYAWGDFAYLLCRVPNHHLALQHMLTLTPQLHKESEMREYLSKALDLFPDDAVLHMMYGAFLHNIGEAQEASKHLARAHELNASDDISRMDPGNFAAEPARPG